jgi:hypothetical protein
MMAKGQMHGNREAKKPKQAKPKLALAVSSFTEALAKGNPLPRHNGGKK